MRKDYSAPELEFRRYRVFTDILTDSDPGLHDGDEFDLDSDDSGLKADGFFADEDD